MACSEIVALTLGHEHVPRGLSLEGGGDELLRLPIIAVLARTASGPVLLDTGISPALRDPAVAAGIYGGTPPPEIPGDGHPLLAALGAAGVRPADLALVVVSHLHVDHTGGLPVLAPGTPVAVQRRELAFARRPDAARAAYRPEDYSGPVAWREVDGDAPIAPGIDAIFTPGHTPGHMSYRVRAADGTTWLFAMDAIDLQEGIDTNTPIGSSAHPADAPFRRASHERLVALAAAEGARLVPGHCPVTWPPDGLRSVAEP